MDQKATSAAVYICPMHSDMRQTRPGKCTKCGMELLPAGTRFGLIRHIISSPFHITIMLGVMAVLMATAMMMLMP